ncbi:DUF3617 domain-containing protein [Sphingopyxis sp.]|uniref:DUF3617 domain-containing protein n=1 Tax=Sphingopyxis sp. TaxID=1908224 RepID=UPI003D119C6F
MKKFVTVAVVGAALALAGCGKSDDAAGAKDGDTAAASSAPVKREAGNWKTEVKLVKFDMPGVPDNVKDQMSKQFAAAGATDQCVTQEQVDKEDLAGALSKGYGDACTWTKNQIGGGKLDVAGSCNQAGQKVELAMAGTLAAKKTDILVTTKGKAPTGGDMEMQLQVVSTNTGPCKS